MNYTYTELILSLLISFAIAGAIYAAYKDDKDFF